MESEREEEERRAAREKEGKGNERRRNGIRVVFLPFLLLSFLCNGQKAAI